jgi:hypothetical protein
VESFEAAWYAGELGLMLGLMPILGAVCVFPEHMTLGRDLLPLIHEHLAAREDEPAQRGKGASALASSSFGTATPPAVVLAAQARSREARVASRAGNRM